MDYYEKEQLCSFSLNNEKEQVPSTILIKDEENSQENSYMVLLNLIYQYKYHYPDNVKKVYANILLYLTNLIKIINTFKINYSKERTNSNICLQISNFYNYIYNLDQNIQKINDINSYNNLIFIRIKQFLNTLEYIFINFYKFDINKQKNQLDLLYNIITKEKTNLKKGKQFIKFYNQTKIIYTTYGTCKSYGSYAPYDLHNQQQIILDSASDKMNTHGCLTNIINFILDKKQDNKLTIN